MRKIAIIGSGQAGLVCAHGLRKAGHAVTLYSDRTPEAWLSQSRPTGAAARFWPALAYERELGLNHWESTTTKFDGIHVTLCPAPQNRLLTSTGRMAGPGVAIDLRLQCHRWMHDLVDRGGKIEIGEVTVPRLEEIAREHDLTIVSTGKGGLASLFSRNEPRSVYSEAQRHVSMVIFKGRPMHQTELPFPAVRYGIFAFAGESFLLPFHHKDGGPSWLIGWEAKTGSVMDRFRDAHSATEVLDISREIARELMPWDRRWFEDTEACDELGFQVGTVTPAVRHPAGRLPSGQVVASLGDTAIACDPIAAQGANGGNKMARHLVAAVTARGDRPFDEAWITDTFERYWSETARHAVALTNLLLEPPTPMAMAFLVAQYGSDGRDGRNDGKQALADAFAENLADPASLTPVLLDEAKIRGFIRDKTSGFVRTVAKSVPGIVRGQIRQRFGRDPGHPLVTGAVAG
jgi:2-polyprenyl-6-methoxyphenol hydroxylase-like FAD-dependent oxidoreductase